MAETGSYGDIIFEASEERVRTFANLNRTHRARWVEHEVAAVKSVLEFAGVDLQPLSLEIRLDARWLNPAREIEALQEILEAGQPEVLVIGGQVLGEFVLEEIGENRRHTDAAGRLLVADLQLQFKEHN